MKNLKKFVCLLLAALTVFALCACGSSEKSALDEIQEKYGFPAHAIVTMEEVVERLYNQECQGKIVIDDSIKAAIDSYYEQYGAK